MLRRILPVVLALGAISPAQAQQVSAAAAPASWVRYAERATATVSAWLEADEPAAAGVRAALGAAGGDADTNVLPLSLWVDPEGRVARIAFPRPADPAAGQGLHDLIVGRQLAGSPPRDMKLPLHILVEVKPAAPAN